MATEKIPKSELGRFSTVIAAISFSAGTILLGIHLLVPANIDVCVIAFFYIILVGLLNTIVLVNLLIQFIKNREFREYFAIKILIVLANIPIAIYYTNVAFSFKLF